MTSLLRKAGTLVSSSRIRIARDTTDTDAETRMHKVGSSMRLIYWVLVDGEWRIVCSSDGANGVEVAE